MEKKMSKFEYKIMASIGMPVRNLFMPPHKMLTEVDINPGYKVLDYGCGPGAFAIMIAEKIGQSGIVYALDIHPLAIKAAEQKARKKIYQILKLFYQAVQLSFPTTALIL